MPKYTTLDGMELEDSYKGLTDALKHDIRLATLKKAKVEADHAELEAKEYERQVSFTNNANLRNRVLPFVGEVNDESVEQAVDVLTRWARASAEPITVRFTSPGGEVMSGLVMFDTIRAVVEDGVPVKTVVQGRAASMAAILLQAGSERIIAPHAYILIHEGKSTLTTNGPTMITRKYAEMEDDAKFGKRLNKDMASILAERSKLSTREILSKIQKGDWSLGADECIRYGFADRVGFK